MKTLVINLSLLVILATTTVLRAQPIIFVTTDPNVPPCAGLVDDGIGMKSVYVVLAGSLGSARFAVEEGPGMNMPYIGETHFVAGTMGTLHGGLTVCAAVCMSDPPVTLARVDYTSNGTSTVCSEIRIIPAPGFDGVDIMDCSGNNYGALVSPLYVNIDIDEQFCSTLCDSEFAPPSTEGFACAPLPVQETTWGAIKALYN